MSKHWVGSSSKVHNPNLERSSRTNCFQKLRERFERTDNPNYERTTIAHEVSFEQNKAYITLLNK